MKKFLILNTETMRFSFKDTEEEAREEYKNFVYEAAENGFYDGCVILTEIKKSVGVESIVKAALNE
ncbi:hypothetical protein MOF21_08420 [Bacillus haynesii]|uniref:hypothetical protein n=1 Tax=Bacillus haynesii TaxID=1925021 RepID=UPI0022820585|nr:hypothetical protein [Bacillus haynesii]MCY9329959.1 hypothetical protein [Bacillus haynesii]